MSTTSTTMSSLVLVLVLGASVLSGCGSDARGEAPPGPATDTVVERAPNYLGDPADQRFRDQFWGDHVHDSWNKCHIGEGVAHKPQPGEDCWSRLKAQTER